MDPETEWRWHMWRSKPDGDPLGEYWRGRWEQRVKERAEGARPTDQNGTLSSSNAAGGGACVTCSD